MSTLLVVTLTKDGFNNLDGSYSCLMSALIIAAKKQGLNNPGDF